MKCALVCDFIRLASIELMRQHTQVEKYTTIHADELIRHPNPIATLHFAAQTLKAQERAAIHAFEEIVRFTIGLPLRWQIR